jgi:hypothetical protein
MQLGGQLFKGQGTIPSEKYRHLDLVADTEEDLDLNIPKSTDEYRDILKYAPKWTTWPDFEQVRWVNSIIEWLWPHLARAICKMVRIMTQHTLGGERRQGCSLHKRLRAENLYWNLKVSCATIQPIMDGSHQCDRIQHGDVGLVKV